MFHGLFVSRESSILNFFLAQEMSRAFGEFYFTRQNHIYSIFFFNYRISCLQIALGNGHYLLGDKGGGGGGHCIWGEDHYFLVQFWGWPLLFVMLFRGGL